MNGRPDRRPDNKRIVVPELPQSITSAGALRLLQPLPSIQRASPSRKICTPIWRNAWTVRELSSPPDKLKIRLRPSATPAKMTARWAIDLSPGTVSSPRSGCWLSAIRSTLCNLRYLRSNLIGPRELSFELRALAILNPTFELFQILDVIAQAFADGFSIHQANVPPKLGTARS